MAGIAIPRFLEATRTARGAKIVADMRTLESAVYVYYAKTGAYPDNSDGMTQLVQGGWPTPPIGDVTIAYTNKDGTTGQYAFKTTSRSYYDYAGEAVDDATKTGFITLNGISDDSSNVSGASAISGSHTVVEMITGAVKTQG